VCWLTYRRVCAFVFDIIIAQIFNTFLKNISAFLKMSVYFAFYFILLSTERSIAPLSSRVVFGPSVAGATSSEFRAEFDISASRTTTQTQLRGPSLATVVVYLKYIVSQLSRYQLALQKATDAPMSGRVVSSTKAETNGSDGPHHQELRPRAFLAFDIPSFQVSETATETMTPQQLQLLQHRRKTQLLTEKKQTIAQLLYLIENLLFILWRHLDYFINEAPIVDESRMDLETKSELMALKPSPSKKKQKLLQMSVESLKLTNEQRTTLIQDLSLSLEQDQHRTLDQLLKLSKQENMSMMAVLVRRIKDLIKTNEQ
jgi:hypothetical protein